MDPVVLFKLVLLQHLYGIPSLRRTVAEAEMTVAYRWFLGYGLMERIPHFATVSYAFRNRFDTEMVEGIFEWILGEIEKAGYLSPEAVYVDGTHIKASANLKKQVKKEIPKAARAYEKELREEVNKDREAHGKKPFDDDDDPPMGTKEITESKTDPESGLFHKDEHKRCFAYILCMEEIQNRYECWISTMLICDCGKRIRRMDALFTEMFGERPHYKCKKKSRRRK